MINKDDIVNIRTSVLGGLNKNDVTKYIQLLQNQIQTMGEQSDIQQQKMDELRKNLNNAEIFYRALWNNCESQKETIYYQKELIAQLKKKDYYPELQLQGHQKLLEAQEKELKKCQTLFEKQEEELKKRQSLLETQEKELKKRQSLLETQEKELMKRQTLHEKQEKELKKRQVLLIAQEKEWIDRQEQILDLPEYSNDEKKEKKKQKKKDKKKDKK